MSSPDELGIRTRAAFGIFEEALVAVVGGDAPLHA